MNFSAFDAQPKLGNDTFLYLSPTRSGSMEFAQCATCRDFLPGRKRCAILGTSFAVAPGGSCGLYVPGEPTDDQRTVARVKPAAAGYVDRPVRCENCVHADLKRGKCGFFERMNRTGLYDLDTRIEPKACCNANQQK